MHGAGVSKVGQRACVLTLHAGREGGDGRRSLAQGARSAAGRYAGRPGRRRPRDGDSGLLGADYPGLKPALKVDIGDRVALGQTLFEDKQSPGVRFAAPAGGTVSAIHRGARRSLVSVVISVDASIAPIEFAAAARARARPDAESVRELLLEAGLWPALRTRPFARVPSPTDRPAAIFVTATDTRPHAIAPAGVIAARAEDFDCGLQLLAALGHKLFVCVAEGHRVAAPPGADVVEFAGPHPSGNAGWHIHRLLPVSLHRSVWTIGYQDVIALGRLAATGVLDVERVVALGGPGVAASATAAYAPRRIARRTARR